MENIKVRCRCCGREIEGFSNKTVTCGCSNMTTIRGNSITANSLENVVMISFPKDSKNTSLSSDDIEWQKSRMNRKVRKLDFEIK